MTRNCNFKVQLIRLRMHRPFKSLPSEPLVRPSEPLVRPSDSRPSDSRPSDSRPSEFLAPRSASRPFESPVRPSASRPFESPVRRNAARPFETLVHPNADRPFVRPNERLVRTSRDRQKGVFRQSDAIRPDITHPIGTYRERLMIHDVREEDYRVLHPVTKRSTTNEIRSTTGETNLLLPRVRPSFDFDHTQRIMCPVKDHHPMNETYSNHDGRIC